MLVSTILAAAEQRGVEFIAEGDMLRVRRLKRLDVKTAETLRAHKSEILEILRAREAVVRRAEELLAQARAIREGIFPLPEPQVCTFHIGAAGNTCRRCGASWLAHFPEDQNK